MTACGLVMTILLCVCFKMKRTFLLKIMLIYEKLVLSSQPPLSGHLLVFQGWSISGSLNFIRLLRVVITPSVVERRKRLEAIG